MAYESVYEDKQKEGLSMIGSSDFMPLGLSISYVHHSDSRNQYQSPGALKPWKRLIGGLLLYLGFLQHSRFKDRFKDACNMLLPTLCQWPWSGGTNRFFGAHRYYFALAWPHGRDSFMRMTFA